MGLEPLPSYYSKLAILSTSWASAAEQQFMEGCPFLGNSEGPGPSRFSCVDSLHDTTLVGGEGLKLLRWRRSVLERGVDLLIENAAPSRLFYRPRPGRDCPDTMQLPCCTAVVEVLAA